VPSAPLILGLDHAQLTVPKGQEEAARRFYGDVLGLREIPKPQSLQARGGLWFAIGELQLQIGVEDGVDRAATKAHLAYQVMPVRGKSGCACTGYRCSIRFPFPAFNGSNSAIRSATALR
jgi:catechol 2,3-dioxygenase-like lactoylglutathione lyase family enzyme